MDLNRVLVFVRVAETESFTAAAEALGLPKSSVSRSVARLEEELGVRLLQRTTRKLSLTDGGRRYFERARAALATLSEATSEAADLGKSPRGTIKVTAPVDAAIGVLSSIVARFTARNPEIKIELHLTARIVDLVEEGFDLAVRAGRLDDSSLIVRKVGQSEIGLYASSTWLAREGAPNSLREVESRECVVFRGREGRGILRMTGPGGEETLRLSGPVEVDDLGFVRECILLHMGIGALPSFLAAPHVARGELVRLFPEYGVRGAALHVVSPSKQHEPARVGLFREFLIRELSAYDWTTGSRA